MRKRCGAISSNNFLTSKFKWKTIFVFLQHVVAAQPFADYNRTKKNFVQNYYQFGQLCKRAISAKSQKKSDGNCLSSNVNISIETSIRLGAFLLPTTALQSIQVALLILQCLFSQHPGKKSGGWWEEGMNEKPNDCWYGKHVFFLVSLAAPSYFDCMLCPQSGREIDEHTK